MAIKPRKLRFAVDVDAAGMLRDENAVGLDAPPEWTAEHLLLAALVRCSLTSFRYHAQRSGLTVGETSGSARGMVTKRESDERYAFVEVDVELTVALDPEPDNGAELLEKAERDCFIGASLTVKPSYRWSVN